MKKQRKTIWNRMISIATALVMILSYLSASATVISAEESVDETEPKVYEYVTSFAALSGSKLPATTGDEYLTNCYTYRGAQISNPAMLSSTYQANLNAAGESVEPWTIMDDTVTDAWDLLNWSVYNWYLLSDSRNLQMVFKTDRYSDEELTSYVAFKINIDKAGTYDFHTAVNVHKAGVMASPAVYIAPYSTYA